MDEVSSVIPDHLVNNGSGMDRCGVRESINRAEEKTDQELVKACLANSEPDWEALIARYERLIFSIPIKLGMSSQEALEIFQSVCFILLKKLPQLRKQERIYSWLITTTTRECWRVRALKRRDAAPAGVEGSNGLRTAQAAPTPEQLAYERRVADEQNRVVREAVLALPEKCRELIIMLFYLNEEPTYEDIAVRLNMPVSSIGPTRARCLQKLKKILAEKLPGG
jgi:RNA polymerase sigma factor (sigma-70 family)